MREILEAIIDTIYELEILRQKRPERPLVRPSLSYRFAQRLIDRSTKILLSYVRLKAGQLLPRATKIVSSWLAEFDADVLKQDEDEELEEELRRRGFSRRDIAMIMALAATYRPLRDGFGALLGDTLVTTYRNAHRTSVAQILSRRGLKPSQVKIPEPDASLTGRGALATRYRKYAKPAVATLDKKVAVGLAGTLRKARTAGMTRQDSARLLLDSLNPRRPAFVATEYFFVRIAQTETASAVAEAKRQAFEDMEVDEVMFVSMRDENVCEECEELDGEIFSVAESQGIIPVHPNCRCTWAPVGSGAAPI